MAQTMIETIPQDQRCDICRDAILPPVPDCVKCQSSKLRIDTMSEAQWTPLSDKTVDKCHLCKQVDVDGELTGYFICEECLLNKLKVESHNHCNKCGKEIPIYRDSGTNQGYESQTFHLHEAGVGGVNGTRHVKMRLCRECYRTDFARKYPPKAVSA